MLRFMSYHSSAAVGMNHRGPLETALSLECHVALVAALERRTKRRQVAALQRVDASNKMGDQQNAEKEVPLDLDFEQARLAYSIIESLIEHTRVVSDLIALMAQVLDEDTTKALTQTPTWTAYLDSRRAMEKTKTDVEKFADVLRQLKPE